MLLNMGWCHAFTSDQILTMILFGLKEIMLCGLGACKLNSMHVICFFLCVLNIFIRKKNHVPDHSV